MKSGLQLRKEICQTILADHARKSPIEVIILTISEKGEMILDVNTATPTQMHVYLHELEVMIHEEWRKYKEKMIALGEVSGETQQKSN